ncbi:MAG: hypothetical protein JWM88_2697 [Verrucomicrobia bacterium]|nr:hypothetical protein [Verrucomicrobiota bacterium]
MIEGWENFYVIVGSSAGALIGLQFVVITLLADLPITQGSAQVGRTFATPSVVHFGVVLLLSAIGSAPWTRIGPVAVLWALTGAGGLVYTATVAREIRAQHTYKPVFEDWMFHVLLPLVAYAALATSAGLAVSRPHPALFGVAAASMVLLFVGIHNAWDAATYHVFVQRRQQRGLTRSNKPKE